MAKNVAVVMSGCGFEDGTEIHEAVSCLIHLSRLGFVYRCFAPDQPQARTINHATGEATGERRNMMVESARIARGMIEPLAQLKANDFDAVAFPGGFGAATSLCTFASGGGATCEVNPDVSRVLNDFYAGKKPVVLCCIAPVLGARVLGTKAGGPGVSVTVGNDAGVANAIAAMGARHIDKAVNEALVDRDHRVITTPAYMYDAKPYEVFQGIGKAMDELATMLR